MTQDEFYLELAKIKDKYNWRINSQHRIRGKLIDATCDCCKVDFCPINAVAREKDGKSNSDNGVFFSIQKLELENAAEILHLADNAQFVENKIRDLLINGL